MKSFYRHSTRIFTILFSVVSFSLFAQTTVAPNATQNGVKEESPSRDKQKNLSPVPTQEEKSDLPAQRATYRTLPTDAQGRPLPMSVDEVVKMVLENSNIVTLQQLEVLKADSAILKDESKYTPKFGLAYQGFVREDKNQPQSAMTGTKITNDTYTASLSKLFSSGTYAAIEGSDTRFDSNAGEALQYQGTFLSQLAQPPVHTGSLALVLRQELLKNSFGYSLRRLNELAKNQSLVQRQQQIYMLSQVVVGTMVEYWGLAVAEERVDTAELLLKNTNYIYNITYRKQALGLSEPFELNQWNALKDVAESKLAGSQLELAQKKSALLRSLNLDPKLNLTGATKLYETIPYKINVEEDIKYALNTRPDLKHIQFQKRSAELARDMTTNNLLPSLTLSGKYASRDWGRHANTAWGSVPDAIYPEKSIELRLEYPLWDSGAKADARDAKVSLRQLTIQEEQMRRQVEDDIRLGAQQIQTAYQVMLKAKNAMQQTEAFYNGLVTRYRQGIFTAEAVKQALDAVVESRLGYLQTKVNFNIALVRYDMLRNQLWERYDVNIDQVLDRLKLED